MGKERAGRLARGVGREGGRSPKFNYSNFFERWRFSGSMLIPAGTRAVSRDDSRRTGGERLILNVRRVEMHAVTARPLCKAG